MLEHLKSQIGDKQTKDMTKDELQFYYFNIGFSIKCHILDKHLGSQIGADQWIVSLDENPNFRQHDYDGNNQLDGIELIQGKLLHWPIR